MYEAEAGIVGGVEGNSSVFFEQWFCILADYLYWTDVWRLSPFCVSNIGIGAVLSKMLANTYMISMDFFFLFSLDLFDFDSREVVTTGYIRD